MGKMTPPFTIRVNSCSCHRRCESTLSTLTAKISVPSSWNAGYLTATAANSVGQTEVKSPG